MCSCCITILNYYADALTAPIVHAWWLLIASTNLIFY